MKTIYTLSITAIMLVFFALPLWGNIPAQERAALIALYNSTNGDSWTDNSGWKDGILEADGFAAYGSENTWFGITCDAGNTTVTEIAIYSNNLTGNVPPELGNLTNLTNFEIAYNQLSGSIPPEFSNLSNLSSLSLYSNQLTGNIPTALGNLSNLISLRLGFNQLTGNIPAQFGALSSLATLDICNNQLTGSIPPELGNLSNLHSLYLYNNQLTGTIPPELGNLSSLYTLSIYNNQVSGSIPPELGNLSNLDTLRIHHIQLTGTIPPELGNLSNIKSFYLNNNQLTGTIPPELGNLSNVEILAVSGNQLTGSIPVELGNLSNLIHLSLRENQLTGSIPPVLGSLPSLIGLNLNDNQLSGSIPPELGNLASLKYFYLNGNAFSGEIPISLTNFTNLSIADIGYNVLFTADATLVAFLNSNDPDWANTQTIAPTNPAASAQSNTSIMLTWTPIPYTSDTGSYRVFYSTIPGGPYSFFDTTTDKTISQMEATGLAPGTQYYFVIQTHTDAHAGNQNALDSEYSQEVSATTPSPRIPPIERAALIALYNSTDGDNWLNNSGWKDGILEADGFAAFGTETYWYGINCDVTNTRVLRISLGTNYLAGTIPSQLGDLLHLTRLSLYNNQLTGGIPSELGNLTNLQTLHLNSTQLTGTIPAELGNLSNLQTLWLHSNQLTGPIPAELGDLSSIQTLYLNRNSLSGSIPIELGNLSTLTTLSLYSNQLTGDIPSQLGNLANLQVLYLFQNQLSGTIPTALCNLTNLTHLYLNDNQLTGSIPTEIGNLTNITHIRLNDNQLSGTIPTVLGSLSNLTNLYLAQNQISGTIPTELGNLSGLEILDLKANRLSGNIPTTLTNLTNINSNWSHIGYNSLYSSNAPLITFLDINFPYWSSTQTIAPNGVSIASASATSVTVSWTPITFTSFSGGYRVFHSDTPGGPYTLFDTTTDKTISQMEVTGLDPGTQYYFVIQTHTDAHLNNQNALDSEFSQEVSATTPGIITVTSPQKNDVYNARTVIHIQWDAPGFTGEVEIRLYMADETVNYLISDHQPVGTPLDYTVADTIAKGIYFIEVRQGSIFGRSGNFYIDNQSRIIQVPSPSG